MTLTRAGRLSRLLVAFLAGSFFWATAAASPEPEVPVRGKLIIKGKSLTFSRVWLVRGPDTSDAAKPSAYLILSSQDISAALAACEDINCALWKTLKDGAILQPLEDGHNSFWLRVLSRELPKEQQLSGRQWLPAIDRHDHLSGKLEFAYLNTQDEADLEIDAVLIKEFPVSRP